MAKTKSWNIQSEDSKDTISVEFHNFTGNHKIFINSEQYYYKPTFMEKLVGVQLGFKLSNKEVVLELRGNRADVAVGGYYLDSKKEFKVIGGVPKWAWIFVIACMAIPIYSLGGAIPAVIGVLGAMVAAKASIQTNNQMLNFALSLAAALIAWGVFFIFLEFMSSLL